MKTPNWTLLTTAVAAAAISSPPSLMRSKSRVTPPGRPSTVSTGLMTMLTAEVTGRATADLTRFTYSIIRGTGT